MVQPPRTAGAPIDPVGLAHICKSISALLATTDWTLGKGDSDEMSDVAARRTIDKDILLCYLPQSELWSSLATLSCTELSNDKIWLIIYCVFISKMASNRLGVGHPGLWHDCGRHGLDMEVLCSDQPALTAGDKWGGHPEEGPEHQPD